MIYNDDVNATVLENAPGNASYSSHHIQKELLSICGKRIQKHIREEVGDGKFCIIVDESRDEAKREQMTIVLRFVDKEGFIRERFFALVHVEDTKALTLKKHICEVLSHNNLRVQDIRGQGYDGASTMSGMWNGLQALFLKECPFAYYVHCFAHRLQLVLVATSRGIVPIDKFFTRLISIINMVDSSAKRHDQLRIVEALRIEELISTDDLETCKGKNQIKSMQRPADTRWSSHLKSISNMIDLFDSTLVVLNEFLDDPSFHSRGTVDEITDMMVSFEFIFTSHFMRELLGRVDDLCRLLQSKSQDIANAMDAVSNTKKVIQNFREKGWDMVMNEVKTFCEKQGIPIPDLSDTRQTNKGFVQRRNLITWEHHLRVDTFNATIDRILQEMNSRFNEETLELLRLSCALDPKGNYARFNIHDLCKLAETFYPNDFTNQERRQLRIQLELFEVEIRNNVEFQNLSTLSELCIVLARTGKSILYSLVDHLIRLLLILPVSTATSERTFSAMKIVKTRLRSTMEHEFLCNLLLMYMEKEIARGFDVDSIIDEFEISKKRRVKFR